MNRVLSYLLVVSLMFAAITALLRLAMPIQAAMIVGALIVVVGGRIQRIIYRDYYRGLKFVRLGQYADALPYLESFLERLKAKPRLRHYVWLSYCRYTWDMPAMVLNAMGGCLIQTGQPDRAVELLSQAVQRVPKYGPAWYNLAIASAMRGSDKVASFAENARKTGLSWCTEELVRDRAAELSY